MLRLSEVLGRTVLGADGRTVGRLLDLVVRLEPDPRVVRLRIRLGGGSTADVSWLGVASFDDPIRLGARAEPIAPALADHELLLARHVLDAQIIDRRGRSLTRVGDIELSLQSGNLDVGAVEIGARPLLRRLGLGRWAGRAGSRAIPWSELHLASHRGRIVQLAATAALPAGEPAPSHSELLERLAPTAHRRRRFRFRWIRRRATS